MFSLNYLSGCARVDGEGIERFWADSNGLATSTREMAPGSRHDFLDFHWSAVNFKKVVGLGTSLYTRLQKASKGREKRTRELKELKASFPEDVIEDWEKMIVDWQLDPTSHQDPYQEIAADFTLKDAEKVLEQVGVRDDEVIDVGRETTEAGFLIQGLELEVEQ